MCLETSDLLGLAGLGHEVHRLAHPHLGVQGTQLFVQGEHVTGTDSQAQEE